MLAPSEPESEPRAAGFEALADVTCPVSVVLGTGTITVREVLTLQPETVLRLRQPAGGDLQMLVGGLLLARGEVVVVEDTTAIRVTEIARRASRGDLR